MKKTKYIQAISASVATLFSSTWYVMLAAGVIHAHLLAAIQPIGYWQALPVALLVNFILDAGSYRARYDNALLDQR